MKSKKIKYPCLNESAFFVLSNAHNDLRAIQEEHEKTIKHLTMRTNLLFLCVLGLLFMVFALMFAKGVF